MKTFQALVSSALLLLAGGLLAANGDQPAPRQPPQAASSAPTNVKVQSASLPARGLFEEDRLTSSARRQLTELLIDALGLQIEVVLLVPTGPWATDGSGKDERDLTPARLQAVRRFFGERGIDPNHIFVESRIDKGIKEARIDIQVVGRPAND